MGNRRMIVNLKEANEFLKSVNEIENNYRLVLNHIENSKVTEAHVEDLKECSITNKRLGFIEGIRYTCEKLGLDINFNKVNIK